ncbi:SUKH-3 domain-containing protein [Flavobacterium hungaricum]|uniref:SUKH-3 immunity protein n=1 Tax=Flavobacterium hungaricum TaxID=2082725 RepID=A0ABR9TF49_9FLAO|nr:SUKH-3 domain-containing protein [Flavobacterium hungaricum]MBE8723975.1 hypothetical protein [Flavobacterium hungaricum]
MSKKEQDIKSVLKVAGWYEGRSLKSKIENTLVYQILPKKVQEFYCEFGDLTIHAENKIETMIINTTHFNDQKVFDYHSSLIYKIQDEIDLSKSEDLYYYSTLVGTHLYPIGRLIEHNTLLMDENGNFYIIDFIPQLIWVSNNTFDALSIIIFGLGRFGIFNEHNMKWMFAKDEELLYNPPINPLLTENPW